MGHKRLQIKTRKSSKCVDWSQRPRGLQVTQDRGHVDPFPVQREPLDPEQDFDPRASGGKFHEKWEQGAR